jgi:hypothetical protein
MVLSPNSCWRLFSCFCFYHTHNCWDLGSLERSVYFILLLDLEEKTQCCLDQKQISREKFLTRLFWVICTISNVFMLKILNKTTHKHHRFLQLKFCI